MPVNNAVDIVDLGSAYSFPASDPPSYMASIAIPGMPSHDKMDSAKPPSQAQADLDESGLREELEGTLQDTLRVEGQGAARSPKAK
jgi:hypothetical protein